MTTGYVYKLCCSDVKVTEIYVGSTKSLRNRRSEHKSCCNNPNDGDYNLPVYQYIRENGGWLNWSLIVVETIQYREKHELRARERHWIETLHATLNVVVPFRTEGEITNLRAQYQRNFRARNPESILQTKTKYFESHKNIIYEKQSRKVTCECGTTVSHHFLTKHCKTAKHLALIAAQSIATPNIASPTTAENDEQLNRAQDVQQVQSSNDP